jgi:hypothetical protein
VRGYTLPEIGNVREAGRREESGFKMCVGNTTPLGKGTRCASPLQSPGRKRDRKPTCTDSQRAHLCKLLFACAGIWQNGPVEIT